MMGIYLLNQFLFNKSKEQENDLDKIYYILPTTLLTIHTFERFERFLERFCQIY
jgi:reverse gyrase